MACPQDKRIIRCVLSCMTDHLHLASVFFLDIVLGILLCYILSEPGEDEPNMKLMSAQPLLHLVPLTSISFFHGQSINIQLPLTRGTTVCMMTNFRS